MLLSRFNDFALDVKDKVMAGDKLQWEWYWYAQ